MSLLQTVITGNIGNDAELKKVAGTDLAEFSVAVTVGFGEKKKTEWVRCTLWGKRAPGLQPYLTKGTTVAVIGEVSAHAYMSKKDGEAKAELRLRVDQIELLGGGKRGERQAASSEEVPFDSAPATEKDPFEI